MKHIRNLKLNERRKKKHIYLYYKNNNKEN